MLSKTGCSVLLALLVAPLSRTQSVTVYGVKSCGSSPGVCAGVPSTVPASLFRFDAGGSSFNDLGRLRENGVDVDLDGLAWSAAHGLCGFVLGAASPRSSTLVGIDPLTAAVTRRGAPLAREIRGAVFAMDESLLALDVIGNSLLRIDPVTGTEIAAPLPIVVGGVPLALSNVCDLAVRDDAAVFLVALDTIYALDTATGIANVLRVDTGQALAGAAFARGRPSNELCVYEVNHTDDLFRYDLGTAGVPRSDLFLDIIPSFNAGRGDLAALRRDDLFARCAFRNGHGINPIGYGCVSSPVLGSVWQTSIAMPPGALASMVAIGLFPELGLPFDGGEILIGLLPTPLLLVGTGTHAVTIPNQVALLGTLVPTQDFRLDSSPSGNRLVPLNAQDLVLGT